MTPQQIQDTSRNLDGKMDELISQMKGIQMEMTHFTDRAAESMGALSDQLSGVAPSGNFVVDALTVLILAAFVGYYVIWDVTPALHAPLMGITNAISSVIIVGALIAAGPSLFGVSKVLGFIAIVLASVNIFGGFVVTDRMLEMFKGKKK
jgi:NAD(P) transhydrogenase subunit alpha